MFPDEDGNNAMAGRLADEYPKAAVHCRRLTEGILTDIRGKPIYYGYAV